MKIEVLREFLAIAQCQSFTLAAERLYIAQPVLSRHIATLEEQLGVKLFRREYSGVVLTEYGEFLRKRIGKLMTDYDRIMSDFEQLRQGVKSVLIVGGAYHSANDFLGQAPQIFAASPENDGCSLTYILEEPSKCLQGLRTGEIDIALLPSERLTDRSMFNIVKLYEEPIVALMSAHHPFAEKEYLTLKELEKESFLAIENKAGSHYHYGVLDRFVSACEEAGFRPGISKTFNQLETLFYELPNEDGIYIGGRHLIRQCENADIRYVPILGKNCERTIAAICSVENTNPNIPLFLKCFSGVGRFGWERSYIGIEALLEQLDGPDGA